MIAKAKDTTTTAGRREKSAIYVYHQAFCPSCEWVCPDRRQMESDAWGDLQSHLRSTHGGQIREVKIRKTTIEELIEEQE